MHYLYCRDIQQSVDFYVSLGFSIYFDSQDGHGVRHARLSHPDCENMLIALEYFPELLTLSDKLTTIDNHPLKVALTIVTDDYFIWKDKFAGASAEQVLSIIEPYGFWIYYRDPSGNLICVSNTPLW